MAVAIQPKKSEQQTSTHRRRNLFERQKFGHFGRSVHFKNVDVVRSGKWQRYQLDDALGPGGVAELVNGFGVQSVEVVAGDEHVAVDVKRNGLSLFPFSPAASERKKTNAGFSVAKWLVFNIWPFTTLNFCPKPYKICKVSSKFCQIVN